MSTSHWLSERKIQELKALYQTDPAEILRTFNGICWISCTKKKAHKNAQSTSIAMLSLKRKRPGMIHKDVLTYIVKRFIWPTRDNYEIWTNFMEHNATCPQAIDDVD